MAEDEAFALEARLGMAVFGSEDAREGRGLFLSSGARSSEIARARGRPLNVMS